MKLKNKISLMYFFLLFGTSFNFIALRKGYGIMPTGRFILGDIIAFGINNTLILFSIGDILIILSIIIFIKLNFSKL